MNATGLKCIFKCNYWQPLAVNAITDLFEACGPFASFIAIYPRLSLSKDHFYFPVWELLVCWCSGGRGPAVGAGAGLGVKPESAEGPGRGGASLQRWAQIRGGLFCWQRERGFALEPGTDLGPGVHCARAFRVLRRGCLVFVFFFFPPFLK